MRREGHRRVSNLKVKTNIRLKMQYHASFVIHNILIDNEGGDEVRATGMYTDVNNNFWEKSSGVTILKKSLLFKPSKKQLPNQ